MTRVRLPRNLPDDLRRELVQLLDEARVSVDQGVPEAADDCEAAPEPNEDAAPAPDAADPSEAFPGPDEVVASAPGNIRSREGSDLEQEASDVEPVGAGSRSTETGGPTEDDCGPDGRDPPPVVLVVLPFPPGGGCEEAALEGVRAGSRVVGVWRPGSGSTSDPVFGDFGGDTVPWEPGRLHDAVNGRPQHLDAGGGRQKAPDTGRGGCK